MPSSSVLRNARVAGDAVNLLERQGGTIVLGADGRPIVGGDRPVYSEEQMQLLRREYEARIQALEAKARAAREEGYAKGEADGRLSERAVLKGQADAVSALSGEILAARRRVLAGAAEDLVALAVAMAGKLCRRVREADPALAVEIVREAVEAMAESDRVVVRLHPEDLQRLHGRRDELKRLLGPEGELRLRADETVVPGGCLVDSPELHIDGTLEGYLQRCTDALTEWARSDDVLDEGGTRGQSAA